jgi:hypothetical protein
MRLGVSLNVKIRQPIDETSAFEILRKRLSRPPQEVIELLGVVGVTKGTLRKTNHGVNRIIPNVGQQGRIHTNPYDQICERVWN